MGRIYYLGLSLVVSLLLTSCGGGNKTGGAFPPALPLACSTLNGIVSVQVQGGLCASTGNTGSGISIASSPPVPPGTISSPSSPAPIIGPSPPPAAQAACKGSATQGAVGRMSYGGGPLIGCANVVVLCLDAPCASFGGTDPCVFWNNLDSSPMIHIADAYVNQTGNNRYVCKNGIEVDGVSTGALSDPQMVNIIAAHLDGMGVNTVYNLFMSPAQYGNSGGCAYHTTGRISGSSVYYSAIEGCGFYNAMEHEMFETITDPDGGLGWTDPTISNSNEIGDICDNAHLPTTLGGGVYNLQQIWSIVQNACVRTSP